MKKIWILWASWSVGTQTIEVLRSYRERYQLISFSVGKNRTFAVDLLREFPEIEVVSFQEEHDAKYVRDLFPKKEIYFWDIGLEKVATAPIDILITSVVWSVGLMPTYKAIEKGITIGLANKETLVAGGDIIIKKAQEKNVKIIPVDSEHSAIFQCLNGENMKQIHSLIITASWWALRDYGEQMMEHVTIENVLAHPNWSMWQKITVDSATMMNKWLEVIEAHHLFSMPYEKIRPVLHRQSVIHSMVEFVDGSIIAQLWTPDMKLPIQYALTYPERSTIHGWTFLDLTKLKELNFETTIPQKKYPCFYMALECGKLGHSYPVVLNAANEIAVWAFLWKQILYAQIATTLQKILDTHRMIKHPSLEEIIEIDASIRELTRKVIAQS
jgi:1-deoxy-D-xylulose-5-phosphate reductoisomerase